MKIECLRITNFNDFCSSSTTFQILRNCILKMIALSCSTTFHFAWGWVGGLELLDRIILLVCMLT